VILFFLFLKVNHDLVRTNGISPRSLSSFGLKVFAFSFVRDFLKKRVCGAFPFFKFLRTGGLK